MFFYPETILSYTLYQIMIQDKNIFINKTLSATLHKIFHIKRDSRQWYNGWTLPDGVKTLRKIAHNLWVCNIAQCLGATGMPLQQFPKAASLCFMKYREDLRWTCSIFCVFCTCYRNVFKFFDFLNTLFV